MTEATPSPPPGQACRHVYETHFTEARAKGLSKEAAHEIGLFAVYVHGKSAGQAWERDHSTRSAV